MAEIHIEEQSNETASEMRTQNIADNSVSYKEVDDSAFRPFWSWQV